MFAFVPLRDTLPEFAEKWFPNFELLDHVGLTEYDVTQDDATFVAHGGLAWLKEIEFDLPGLHVVSVALLAKDGMTQVKFKQQLAPNFELTLKQLDIAFRIKTKLLQRVRLQGKTWVPDLDGKGNPRLPEVVVTAGDLRIDGDWDVSFVSPPAASFPPVKLGGTGIVLEVKEVALWLSSRLPNPPEPGFRGVTIKDAEIHFTGKLRTGVPTTVALTDARIGSSGFSGRIEAKWGKGLPKETPGSDGDEGAGASTGSGSLFGIPFTVESLMVQFKQNAPVDSSIKGTLLLPFFDAPVRVEVSYGLDGGLLVRLDSATGDPLRTLEKPRLLKFELESLGFALDDGVFTARLSGQLTPLFQKDALTWPSFEVRDLSIDSQGHVKLAGGWLNIPDQKYLDFHGFKIEIAQLGFGRNPNGSKWVGFSGGLHLVQGLQAGASVEGLRITWFEGDPDSIRVTLNGAGVELAIPGVLELKGEVSYREITTDTGDTIRRFDGDVTLRLETPQLAIDGTIVIGSLTGPDGGRFNFFAVYVDVELPTGIPLGSTGLGIYGFAGLFALRMEPDKKPDEAWFSIDKGHSFYHRGEAGITDLKRKWVPRKGSLALGAGLTLATYADNGYTFNGRFLLALVLPGPIILLQGAASFLKKRGEGKADEGLFRALAVYDGRGSSLTIGLDAEYKTGKGGELIEIGGSMEAFYAFDDPTAWHLWLGRDEPRAQRIRALFGRFVEANAYFMLDAHQLALGAWFGYANRWGFGPLGVTLEAWAEGNARISFRPSHFHGGLWMHCLVELNAFGFGLGLALDARIEADLFRPYHVLAELSVGIRLPRPFKKRLEATVRLEWGPRPVAPPLPLPLVQVAIEHEKSTVVWPIARGQHLLPVWDDGEGFITTPGAAAQPDLAQLPLAPLDARITLTFGRSVHDTALVGIVPQQLYPADEVIGDPTSGQGVATARYSLDELELSRWNGGAWTPVARSPKVPQYPRLFGAWAATPALPDGGSPPRAGQSKLALWAETPYVFTRSTGTAWEEWVSDGMGPYPCPRVPLATESCFGFESLVAGTEVASPWTHPTGAFTLSWSFGPARVVEATVAAEGMRLPLHVLCFPRAATARGVHLAWARPARSFRILLWGEAQPPQPTFGNVVSDATFATEATCVELSTRPAGTQPNPLALDGVRFTVFGADAAPLPQARIERWGRSPLGLNAGHRLDVELPCPTPWVELVVTRRSPCRIVAYDGRGAVAATQAPSPESGEPVTETVRLAGEAITRLELFSGGCEKLVHAVCYACPRATGPSAGGTDAGGNTYGPFVPGDDGEIDGQGEEVTEVTLTSPTGFCIRRICVTPDPEAGQGVHRAELIRHIEEQLAEWRSSGPVLEPGSFYRLAITTRVDATPIADISLSGQSPIEYAYFRTEGPPGITRLPPPTGVDPDRFDSGLDDLVRYVAQTDPPTVPPAGEKPILYKPFYRAYDLGTEFNESYVEQMYRAGGRDLGLYLFDNANRPARDVKGRLLVLGARWGTADTVTLTEKDEHWVTLIDRATCLETKLDPTTAARAGTLVSADPGRVLAPDTLHEARLVPLLLRETFSGVAPPGLPGGWFAADAGGNGPSAWRVGEQGEPPARFVEQPAPVGETTLVFGASAAWTDYRLSVWVRAAAGEVGVVVRRGAGTGYRFTLGERVRRLVKLANGGAATLAEDHFAYQRNRDYRLTFEVLEGTLRTYVDGEPAFEVADDALASGGIGLYTANAHGARFTDVAVDDLRRTAPVVYRFQLTTSLYANFFHHFHSFDDRAWRADLGADDVAPLLAKAVAPGFAPPQEEEARAFETLAEKTLQAAARQHARRLEITRVARGGGGPLVLLRSPEPLDPKRVQLALTRSTRPLPEGTTPAAVKLAGAEVGAESPSLETVSLLLREAADLTRHRVELREIPWLLDEAAGDPVLFLETFADAGARGRFTTNEPPHPGQPSTWQVESGALVELSGAGGGSEPELPGMHALAGEETWSDCRVTARLRGDAGGELGILLRYVDENNYYRLSAGAALRYRRLVKCVAGVTSVLWEDARGHTAGEPFRLALQAIGPRLVGSFDDEPLFDLRDSAHAAGRAGVYVAASFGARCEALEVRRPSLEARAIFTDRFERGDIAGWTFVDGAAGPVTVTPPDALTHFALRLENGAGIAGDPAWDDVIVQARVGTSGDAAGVMVRSDATGATCYRFSIGDAGRRLEKLAGGAATPLWNNAAAAEPNRLYELTLSAVGETIRGFIDGAAVFAVDDPDIAAGRIGLLSEGTGSFSAVSAWDQGSSFTGWLLDERFGTALPEAWSFVGDDHRWQADQGWLGVSPDKPGTHYALATSPEADEFRLDARLRVDAAASSGILFAWQDPAHHAVLWVSASAVTFARVAGGVATTLASAAATLDAGREYLVTVEHFGGRLSASIDGVPVLAVETPASAGTFGFAVDAQPAQAGAGFRELRVALPQWTTVHAFGAEERLPAGKVVRVHSGAVVTLDPLETPVEARSAAATGERGRVRLPAGGATLRVVAPDGAISHLRPFLPRSAFEPVDFDVLRKADGTAAFLVPRAPLPADTRALALEGVFHRDRAAAGRPMSQAGNRSEERADLSFPFV